MNAAEVTAEDYIPFTIATPEAFRATEAARVPTGPPRRPSHDAYTRLLTRLEPDAEERWAETQPPIRREDGGLVPDDSTLDKPRARFMPSVGTHRSGKHHRVVRGINLRTALWTDGDGRYPCDYRAYRKAADQKTKNDHFRDMPDVAAERGLKPKCAPLDSWYARLENLKRIRSLGWTFLTRLKSSRPVGVERGPVRALAEQASAAAGAVVRLPGYGAPRAFRLVATNGDTSHGATDDLDLTPARQEERAGGRGASRSTAGGWSTTPAWDAVRRVGPAGNSTTSGGRSARSFGWSAIASSPASVGSRPRPKSVARPSGNTSETPCLNFPKWQLRNSYSFLFFLLHSRRVTQHRPAAKQRAKPRESVGCVVPCRGRSASAGPRTSLRVR